MKNLPIEDVLSWERFFNESKKRNFYPPKEIEMFNRLVSHTNNFFVIAAIGAFTPGYLMLVTKKLLPSFSLVDDEQLNELKLEVDVAEVGEVVYVGDGVSRIQGLENVLSSELLEFPNNVFGMAMNLEEDNVGAVLFGESRLVKEDR